MKKDICVYTSHDEKKFSMHVVIQNWIHADEKEAKAFSRAVLNPLLSTTIDSIDWDRKWIDFGVYSRNQQFRLLGSTKYGALRHKQLQHVFNYKNKIIHHEYDIIPDTPEELELLEFEESLITFTGNHNIQYYPSFIEEEKKKYQHNSEHPHEDMLEEDVEKALDIVGREDFQLKDVDGMLIYLLRQAPTYCEVCERNHDHENPFLRLARLDNNTTNVYFYCRRDPDDRYSCIGCYETPESAIHESAIHESATPESAIHSKIESELPPHQEEQYDTEDVIPIFDMNTSIDPFAPDTPKLTILEKMNALSKNAYKK